MARRSSSPGTSAVGGPFPLHRTLNGRSPRRFRFRTNSCGPDAKASMTLAFSTMVLDSVDAAINSAVSPPRSGYRPAGVGDERCGENGSGFEAAPSNRHLPHPQPRILVESPLTD